MHESGSVRRGFMTCKTKVMVYDGHTIMRPLRNWRRRRRHTLSEDAIVTREERGNISVLTMVYRPYNLLGLKLMNALVGQVEAAQKAGSRAIVIRSGLRHFSAGADLDIFDKL